MKTHLYNHIEKKWKNNKEIWSTSNSIFADKYPKGNGSIPETGKIEFIQNKGFERYFQFTQLLNTFLNTNILVQKCMIFY